MPGGELGSDLMVAALDVENVLKGTLEVSQVAFRFPFPDAPGGFGVVRPGQFGVFFLREASATYEVVDLYHPYVVAASEVRQIEAGCTEKVIHQVSAVFEQGVASVQIRRTAIEVLETVSDPSATAGLRLATEDSDLNVRLLAISALISRSDLSFVRSAVDTLLSPRPNVEPYVKDRLAYAIEFGVMKSGGVGVEEIPDLARLLRATDIGARRAAAAALRSTRDQAAIKPLTTALYDSDREVQYQAVIGLAEITGAPSEWSPAYDTFLKDQKRYLDHWRDWAKLSNQRKPPDTSVNK